MMDLRLKILIEGVRRTHVPLTLNKLGGVKGKHAPYCCGCKGLNLHPCAVLRAALELEKEHGNDESS